MKSVSAPPITIMAIASAVAVANLYYNQPMLADMAHTFGASAHAIGLVATATQVGYAAGMPLFVPLGDLTERRRLVTVLFLLVAGSLVGAAVAPNLTVLVAASFCIGLTTVIAQILIPLASDLSSGEGAGKTVGLMQGGILLGILLARTLSGFVSHLLGWRAMYFLAAAMALLFAGVLRSALPVASPRDSLSYRQLMHSLWRLLAELPKLRQVMAVAGCFFAAFSAFWTTLVFLLERPPYHYGSQTAGLFGLVGAVGAGIAPLAGRMADRRSPRFVVKIAVVLVLGAFALFWGFGFHLWGLVVGVVVLDAGVQAAQVANQTRVFALKPEARSRVNSLYMIGYFTGGSIGSLVGASVWGRYGWPGVCAAGAVFMLMAAIALSSLGPSPAPSTAPQSVR
jgi:predicted MFS family arabinose efflux permease